MAVVTSQLWKFLQLNSQSRYFPQLVDGAALYRGKPYTAGLLAYVAARPGVLGAVEVEIIDGAPAPVDPVIEALMVNSGDQVDNVILGAVDAYFAPGGPGATGQG